MPNVKPITEWPDPDEVGQSEYLAIYELCSSMTEQMTEEDASAEEILQHLAAILKEFRDWAEVLLAGQTS